MLTVYVLSRYTAQLPHSKFSETACRCTLSDKEPTALAAFTVKEDAQAALKDYETDVSLYHWHIGSFFSVEEYAVMAYSFEDLTPEECPADTELLQTVQEFMQEYDYEQEVCCVSNLKLECLQSGYQGSGYIETTEDGDWFWREPAAQEDFSDESLFAAGE